MDIEQMKNKKRYERILKLLDQGGDVNKVDENGNSALHLAAYDNDIDTARLLVDSNADVNIKDAYGYTSLHLAAITDSYSIAKLLINNGGDIHALDDEGLIPIDHAVGNRALSVLKLLIENGCDVNHQDDDGDALLHGSVSGDDIDTAKFLVDNGADVNVKNASGRTPLHSAAYWKADSVAKLLIENGGNVNALDDRSHMPIHDVMELGYSPVLRLLIENGADVNAKCEYGKTPLHYASKRDDAAPAINDLISHGADVNATDDMGDTPLHVAAENGSENVIDILLRAGANENAKNHFNEKPEEFVLKYEEAYLGTTVKLAIKKEVGAHRHALKRNKLKQTDDYGILDNNKWTKELEYFVTHLILPKLHVTNTYMKWVLSNSELTPVLVRAVNAILEEGDYDLDTSSYNEDMDPIDYEVMCADILDENGWDAVITNTSGDQGVDIFAKKDGGSVVLQCKKYSSPVGNKAVQEAHAGKGFMDATAAVVVTNSSYTPSAKQLAARLGVLLLHHDELGELSYKLKSLNTQ